MQIDYFELINKIRKKFATEPVEDVYQEYFGGKDFTDELILISGYSLNTKGLDPNELYVAKINSIKKYINSEDDKGNKILKFPNFIDIYLGLMYTKDGLKTYGKSQFGPIIVQDWPIAYFEYYENFVKEFERRLINKIWWSDYEIEVWAKLQEKRKVVEEFENYVYNFESLISMHWHDEDKTIHVDYVEHYNKFVNDIELEIKKIKLFGNNEKRISILENLIDYLNAKSKDLSNYLLVPKVEEISPIKLEANNLEFGEKNEQTEIDQKNDKIEEIEQLPKSVPAKIVLLYELGIYEILKQRIKENNLPRIELAKLISYVINEKSVKYVYSYLNNEDLDPFKNNYNDEARDNPFTHTAIKAMTSILLNCNLKVEKGYPTKIKPIRRGLNKK